MDHPLADMLFDVFGDPFEYIIEFLEGFVVDKKWYSIVDGRVCNQEGKVGVILGLSYPWSHRLKNPPEVIFNPRIVQAILERRLLNASAVYEILAEDYGIELIYESLGVKELYLQWIPKGSLFRIDYNQSYNVYKERIEYLDRRSWHST